MGLFRPYEPGKPADKTASAAPATAGSTGAAPAVSTTDTTPGRPTRKAVPTPTRRQAELDRRQRLNPVRTKKEAKAFERDQRAKVRQKAMVEAESRPEMVLLRDHIDARWNVAEFMLPIMLVVLAVSMFGNTYSPLVLGTMIATWVLLAVVILDLTVMWRSYKKLLAERFPRATPKGLLMMGVNRAMQIRRFRQPPARIKRGSSY
ncbi:MAG TPA: DUF3043 domain-containing protein [Propionibacteriaceae bacterium]|nr:DUF3043 domain-containing protein [Propionibacteriaceae bacterium]HPZ48744.1 DUF3043 domain-containing protein [Propionibacteriaceae bacterium]HQE30955.1 DUF3043 domain-containing protein [Propionibacteriaceae bacterium]